LVDVRCPDFNDVVWSYVAEYAVRRGVPRCKALEGIVIEHMKFVQMMAEKAEVKAAEKEK
jgi:hypothetical protein